MAKKLVACFSATGTTARTAEALAEAAGADLFMIEPAEPYTTADLDWNDKGSRSSREMDDPASRPALKRRVRGMDAYDTVFVGFPIWWYVAPRIVETFLEAHDFSGKTVVPFATSGGSGLGRTEDALRRCCPSGTRWLPGKLLNGRPSAKALRAWVDGLGA